MSEEKLKYEPSSEESAKARDMAMEVEANRSQEIMELTSEIKNLVKKLESKIGSFGDEFTPAGSPTSRYNAEYAMDRSLSLAACKNILGQLESISTH